MTTLSWVCHAKFTGQWWDENGLTAMIQDISALPGTVTVVKLDTMRVLVVEDERKTASFIRKALQAEGFSVDLLHDGSEALTALCSTPFDVAVLDVMLPGRDGLSVVRLMRERNVGIPVLLLSARGQVSEKVEGLNAGAD